MKSILLIDPDKDICSQLSAELTDEGYFVLTANNYRTAMEHIHRHPNLIIMETSMPDMNSFDLMRQLKCNEATSAIPIIVLSSKDSEADEIISLEVGADDYLYKPIHPQRLLARIRSIFRQRYKLRNERADKEILVFKGLEINILNHLITYENTPLVFRRKEFNILALLASQPGKVFTREEISLAVWGESDHTSNRTIDVHIGRIRKKLNPIAPFINTVPGVGYRFHV